MIVSVAIPRDVESMLNNRNRKGIIHDYAQVDRKEGRRRFSRWRDVLFQELLRQPELTNVRDAGIKNSC